MSATPSYSYKHCKRRPKSSASLGVVVSDHGGLHDVPDLQVGILDRLRKLRLQCVLHQRGSFLLLGDLLFWGTKGERLLLALETPKKTYRIMIPIVPFYGRMFCIFGGVVLEQNRKFWHLLWDGEPSPDLKP